MNCIEVYNVLRKKNKEHILAEGRNVRYGLNKVRLHHSRESIEHFICKAMATHILLNKDKGVVSEAEFIDGRKIDVVSINRDGELIGYEFESDGNMDKSGVEGVDLFGIDLRKMPSEARKGLECLEKWLKKEMII